MASDRGLSARTGVPFYLLVDRDPQVMQVMRVVLYSEPNREIGCYDKAVTWKFGETVLVSEPFALEIKTAKPWT